MNFLALSYPLQYAKRLVTYFITPTLLHIGPKVFVRNGRAKQEFPPSPANFLRTIKNTFPEIGKSVHHIK